MVVALLCGERDTRAGRDAPGAAVVDVHTPRFARRSICRSADDDVGVAVAVEVARARHGIAEPAADVWPNQSLARRCTDAVGAAEKNVGAIFLVSPDDDVGVAVAVDVARARHGGAELAGGKRADGGGGHGRLEAVRTSQVE